MLRRLLPFMAAIALAGAVSSRPIGAGDFPPFVMRIEIWDAVREQHSDGRTRGGTAIYRLNYQRKDEWTLRLVSDDLGAAPGQGTACQSGTYAQITPDGAFHTDSRHSNCSGPVRWVWYGVAWHYGWPREVTGDLITYTDPGERVVFHRLSGLPLLYEAGPAGGPVGERIVFKVERLNGVMIVLPSPSPGATAPP